MSTTTPKFRVSANIFKGSRPRQSCIDGPWKGSPEAALDAFKEKLVTLGLETKSVFQPFIAEQMPKETAPLADSKYGYKERQDLDAATQLRLRGVTAYK